MRFHISASVGLALAAIAGAAIAESQPEDVLGASVDGLLDAGHRLNPSLRAAALETAALAAKAEGADALDDPTISDNYQYYKDPGVFSAHTVMLSQSFPLWGKRDLRRDAALADVDAARGRERAAQDDLDEKIKIAYARYFVLSRDIEVEGEMADLSRRMRSAAAARYGQGRGDLASIIQAQSEETSAKIETEQLKGERDAACARLNALIGRPAGSALAEPLKARPLPAAEPIAAELVNRARTANPSLSVADASVVAAQSRRDLSDKAWYPDVTVGGGPLIQTNNRPVGAAVTIGFNIPISWGREASGQQAAAAELGAAQQKYEATALEIEGALGEVIAKLHAARSTQTLLRDEAMPEAHATVQTLLANYSQGKGDLAGVIAAEHLMHQVTLRELQVQLDEQIALAGIERLIGGDL